MRKSPILKEYVAYTVKDADGIPASVFYVPTGACNLNCYQCHNKNSRFKPEFFTVEELKEELLKLKALGVELFIVSGGEPMLFADSIPYSIFTEVLPLRIDTNGLLYEKVKLVSTFVQGFAVDIKIPVRNSYTPEEIERFTEILFWNQTPRFSVGEYAERVRKTLEYLAEKQFPFTLTRTVKYPLLKEEEIEEIKEYAKQLGLKHQVNPFYKIKEEVQ